MGDEVAIAAGVVAAIWAGTVAVAAAVGD